MLKYFLVFFSHFLFTISTFLCKLLVVANAFISDSISREAEVSRHLISLLLFLMKIKTPLIATYT